MNHLLVWFDYVHIYIYIYIIIYTHTVICSCRSPVHELQYNNKDRKQLKYYNNTILIIITVK